ncbi:unnamed protein product, partial [Ectocarpus sp. 13 AM-2016]
PTPSSRAARSIHPSRPSVDAVPAPGAGAAAVGAPSLLLDRRRRGSIAVEPASFCRGEVVDPAALSLPPSATPPPPPLTTTASPLAGPLVAAEEEAPPWPFATGCCCCCCCCCFSGAVSFSAAVSPFFPACRCGANAGTAPDASAASVSAG